MTAMREVISLNGKIGEKMKTALPDKFAQVELPLAEMIIGTDENGIGGRLDRISAITFGDWGETPFSRTIRNLRIEY